MVIVNPKAGRSKGLTDWPVIANNLNEAGIVFSCVFTAHKYHAVELGVKAVRDGYRKILAVGGDGTINEVVTSLFLQKEVPVPAITLAVLPLGNGNDWGRAIGLPRAYKEAVRMFSACHTRLVDICRLEYTETGVPHVRHVVNAAGVGMDSTVIRHYDAMRENGYQGHLMYKLSLAWSFLTYRFRRFRVQADGETLYQGGAFSINVGNGPYKGCGLKTLPHALPDDGRMDLAIVKRISKFKALGLLGKLRTGDYVNDPHVALYRQVQQVVVTPLEKPEKVWVEADGELLAQGPYTFTLLPGGLRVVVP